MKYAFAFVIVALGAASAPAQEAAKPKPEAPSPLETEIRAAVSAFRTAFDKGDAPAVAATFTPEAEVIDESGERTVGREAISARFADLFRESPGVTIVIESESIRPLSADSAIEEGTATLKLGKEGRPETSRYEAIYVKQDGRWLQARIRDFPQETFAPHERLSALEWLLGDWVDEDPSGVIHTSCAWSPDGNYLMRDFRVQVRGQDARTGSQRIGWDPATKQIKSWTFDTDGLHSEQLWSEEEPGRWLIKSSGPREDGQRTTATNVLTRLGKDRASWTSVDRTVGDASIADIETRVLVRRPPPAK